MSYVPQRLTHAGVAHRGTPSTCPNSREAISSETGKSGRCLQIHRGLKGFVTSAGAQWQNKLQDGQPESGAPVCLRRLKAAKVQLAIPGASDRRRES